MNISKHLRSKGFERPAFLSQLKWLMGTSLQIGRLRGQTPHRSRALKPLLACGCRAVLRRVVVRIHLLLGISTITKGVHVRLHEACSHTLSCGSDVVGDARSDGRHKPKKRACQKETRHCRSERDVHHEVRGDRISVKLLQQPVTSSPSFTVSSVRALLSRYDVTAKGKSYIMGARVGGYTYRRLTE